jgi:hypothetical protein
MSAQPLAISSNDDPMHIDKTKIKPLMKQEKQCQHINNLHLYYGKPSHVVCKCLNKHGPHVAHVISITNP